eukprot:CAMPEP_0194304220 /NCGR_PEP_ID=MMETSP0171-20130528/2004_1 /TAXON_ID=218684 /ORGANISM="Corethron pennatum, Strain L29A3" /LENGTH=309 /DNA_ID=CAMNT_0039055421 /DNA_START=44 /DNA_END=973 /DNA_ORIENTATION=+
MTTTPAGPDRCPASGKTTGTCPVLGATASIKLDAAAPPPEVSPPQVPAPAASTESGPKHSFPTKDGAVLQNFTVEQLQNFDGRCRPSSSKKAKTSAASSLGNDDRDPVYVSINFIVFNVSDSRQLYGEGGRYEAFAGKECGVALAKHSLDAAHISDFDGLASLSDDERAKMEGWIEKFGKMRRYVGRVVPPRLLPDAAATVAGSVLASRDGTGTAPEGYAAPSIYVGAGDKVYDVSFGGGHQYGVGGGYHCFAGKDASRALAKMSFDPEEMKPPVRTDDLSEKEMKALEGWIKRFSENSLYPCVGVLEK